MPAFVRTLATLLTAAALVVACGGDDDDPAADSPATGAELAGTITVFAAASLTDAFEELAGAFEAANPGVTVELNFGGSSSLREQILARAPADVFASANEPNMDQVADGGAVEGMSATFVTNQLQIAVPAGNPAGVTGLADFANSDLLIGLCAEQVPCGKFGREALGKAGVEPSVDTNEPDVRSLLTKLEEGELDAGIVYRTDVLVAGERVEGVEIPAAQNVVARYPIAALSASEEPEVAATFVSYVTGSDGQRILASYGFGPP